MTAQEAAEWGKTLSFEKVWAILAEIGQKQAEIGQKQAEAAQRQAEAAAETAQRQAEAAKKQAEAAAEAAQRRAEIDELFKEIGRKQEESAQRQAKMDEQLALLEKHVDRVTANVGGLNRSVGELVETLIAARLWEKFPRYNLTRAYQRLPLYDKNNQIKTDIDILLVNTAMCMAVEVKRELDRKDEVDEHLKRMRLIRQYPPEQVGNKRLVGAMAGGTVNADVKNYAYESGFFVLELTGESVHLIPPPEGFEPKEW
ncbi:MAG: hypothetical protein LBD93_11910 [Treponema sp.]|nr:hypothetical protein [Treponema sp.]